jgi:subtilisin family serine protease
MMGNTRSIVLMTLFLLLFSFSCSPIEKVRTVSSFTSLEDIPLRKLNETFQGEKIPPQFAEKLRDAREKDRFKVLVDFNEQVDLKKFSETLRKKNLKKIRRREAVIQALRFVSEKKEEQIKPLLDALLAEGKINYYKKISIVNRFYAVANATAIFQLAEREDIARIHQEYNSSEQSPGRQLKAVDNITVKKSFTENSWAVAMMGADLAWEWGYDGSGVVIGSLDTGIWLPHEQLKDNFRGGDNSWFDPVTGSKKPSDSKGHGSGVLSCALGTNKNNRIIGIAKGSQWIAALANYRNFYNNIHMTLSADWMLNVGKPDVIVNAWSQGNKKCYEFDLDFINAWKAAEMFPVFAAGNRGPSKASSESPAELSGTFPEGLPVFSVGSIDEQGKVSSFSSRGPSRCGDFTFPTIVAPGENVPFVFPVKLDAYMVYSGTSSATGFAAGAIAILIQKYPELSVSELEKLIKEKAVDKGPPGPDNDYGFGLIYLPPLLEN